MPHAPKLKPMPHPNPSAIAAQLTAYTVTHTASAAAAWAAALRHLDPEGLRAVANTMPADVAGQSIRRHISALADHLQTQPFTLGAK